MPTSTSRAESDGRPASTSGLAEVQQIRWQAARLSVAVGVLLLVVKWTAWLMTGSVAVFGDALESVVHIAATVFMAWCMRLSASPADANHPYGHGKAESLSIGFEGGMILLTSLAVITKAVVAWWHQTPIDGLGWGLALVVSAALINLVLGLHLVRTGKKTGSSMLVADGHHVLSDVWTSTAAICALLLVAVAPAAFATWIDGGIAVAVAIAVAVVAIGLIRESVQGLMDESDPKEVRAVVDAINEIRDPVWLDVHNLRLRRSGDAVFVDLHLVVPSDWTVAHAHDAMERIEDHVLKRLGRSGAVLVHLDHPGMDRYQAMTEIGQRPITVETATRIEAGH